MTPTVISCLSQLFANFDKPSFVHSNRGASLTLQDFKAYLHSRGVATSRTSPYHPPCNQTMWKTVRMFSLTKN